MENLQVFENSEFGELGVMLIDGKEYFPATACAKMLGYANPQEAIRTHCKGVRKMLTPSAGGKQEVNFIPEGDLYRLIMRSKLPNAQRFESWVCDEILPAIRKQGTYIGNENRFTQKLIADTVAETVKQLLPLFAGMRQAAQPREAEPVRRHHYRKSGCTRSTSKGIVETISPELRKEVDEMLAMPDTYTYVDIANFPNANGVQISGTSVQRYHFRMIARARAGAPNQVVPIIIQMPEK